MGVDVALRPRTPRKTTCHCCGSEIDDDEPYFSAGYTHNVGNMAIEAGLYDYVWRPEENGIETAEQLIPHLEAGIALMDADPQRFEAMNPPNGWGDYDGFLAWLKRYLIACKETPDALVSVDR